jgi:oligopeptide transport system permease protein
MLKYLAKRFGQSLVVLFVVITITFFLVRLAPGDPFSGERAMDPYIKRQLMAHYGLDRPAVAQYFTYLGHLVQGDLGPSYINPRTVNEIIADSFPVSAQLGGIALLVALGIGVPAGIVASLHRNTWIDYAAMSFSMMGICMPTFVMGPILALVFAVWLQWFPVALWIGADSWVLPSFALGLVYAAVFARVTRGGMLEVLHQNYLLTARAKGLSRWTILWKHSLRGGLLPLVSVMGPSVAGIISGSFIIEMVFQLPGMGRQFVQSNFNRDYSLILGTVILYSTLITLANLWVDVMQAWMDPRVRKQS